MADDKKNIGPEVEKTETAPAPEQPAPEKVEPIVADPAPAEKTAPTEKSEPTTPESPSPAATEPPKPDKEGKQTDTPDKGDPAPAPSGKVVDFAAAREEAGKDKAPKQKTPKQKTTEPKDKAAAKASKGRPAKAGRAAPDKAKPPTRDKMSQSKAAPENAAPNPQEASAPAALEQPAAPRDATRAEKEEIVYLNLSELRPFKNHPFGVRDDAEMQGLVESVRASGVARATFFTMGHGWEPSASPLIKKGCALPSTMLSQKAPPILPTFCGSWRSPGMRSSMGAAV